jgi:hypothetical protein
MPICWQAMLAAESTREIELGSFTDGQIYRGISSRKYQRMYSGI